MSFNSSSTSISSLDSPKFSCSTSEDNFLMSIAFFTTRVILLLPLSILILYLGHQQWQQQHSFSKTSRSDILTYHLVAMELIWVLGEPLFLWGQSTDSSELIIISFSLSSLTFCGETAFHVLTCVERYLAVVHPIIYLRSKTECGVRIRNVTIGCVWLFCFVWMGLTCYYYPSLPTIPYFCPMISSLVIISFCSLSVLRVLIRPGPGDKGRVDQSKARAFLTIMAVMGVLWLWFGALLVSVSLDASPLLSPRVRCMVRISAFWFNLPSSLVLPLLYLHRTGKLAWCCKNSV